MYEYRLPQSVYVTVWLFVSVALAVVNKLVLSSFNFPLILTAWHMVVASFVTFVAASTTDWLPAVQSREVDFVKYFTRVVPVAIAFVSSATLSNYALARLSISFVQMIKASTPVLVLALSFVLGVEKMSAVYLQIIGLITAGVALCCIAEEAFDNAGFAYQAAACGAEAVRLVVVNLLLRDLKLDPLSSLYYCAPLGAFVVGIAAVVVELPLLDVDDVARVFPGMILASGLLASCMHLAVAALIKNSSARALTFAGVCKDLTLCVFSVAIFSAPLHAVQAIGYGVAIAGTNAYKEYRRNQLLFDRKGLATGMCLALTGRAAQLQAAAAQAAARLDAEGASAQGEPSSPPAGGGATGGAIV